MSLPSRTIADAGCSLAAAAGVVVCASGSVVTAFPEKRWATSTALWSDEQSHAGTRVRAVVAHACGRALSCDDSGNVYKHDGITTATPTHTRLCRGAVVTALAFDAAGGRAVLGGDGVRIIHLESMQVELVKVPVPPPFVAVALSPDQNAVLVGSANRSVAIAPLTENGPKILITAALDPGVRTSEFLDSKVDWTPNGHACIPCPEGVRVYAPKGQTFQQVGTLPVSSSCISVSAVAHSKHTCTFITNTITGELTSMRFDVDNKYRPVAGSTRMLKESGCAGLAVDTSSGTGYAVDDSGACAQLAKICRAAASEKKPAQRDDPSDTEDLEEVVDDLIRQNPGYIEDPNTQRVGKPKAPGRRYNAASGRDLIDDEADEVSGSDEEEDDDADASDDDAPLSERSPTPGGGLNEMSHPGVVMPLVTQAPSHPVIAVGSTKDDGTGRRYLAFNSIGAIRIMNDGSATVAFHDKSRPMIRTTSRGRCLMASLGTSSASFIWEHEVGEHAVRYDLVVKPFASASSGLSDWTVTLPNYDAPSVLAQCKRFTVVFGERYMRVFGVGGIEIHLSCMTNVIAAAGLNTTRCHPTTDPLTIVRRVGVELQLSVLDCEASGGVLQQPCAIPLAKDSRLRWFGWSDDGHLFFQDSDGNARMLTTGWGAAWMPVLDTAAQPESAGAWVWGAQEDKLWAVVCGEGAEPAVASDLPAPSYVNMLVPTTRAEMGERGALLRQHHMRHSAKLNAAKGTAQCYTEALAKEDSRLDAFMLRALEAEMKSGAQVGRCIDMATQLQLVDSLEQAARMAHQQNLTFLCEKLLALVSARVKGKKRRLCDLPGEAAFVTDKEKDRMLRRLLAEERSRSGVRGAVDRPKADPIGSQATPEKAVSEPLALTAAPAAAAVVPQPPAAPVVKAEPVVSSRATPATTVETPKPSLQAAGKAFNPFSSKAVPKTQQAAAALPAVASPPKPVTLQQRTLTASVPSPPKHAAAAAVPKSSPAKDPFVTASQATDATTAASWRDMDAPRTSGLSLRDDPTEGPVAPPASVAAALSKRLRDEESDEDDEEGMRGFGKLLPRAE